MSRTEDIDINGFVRRELRHRRPKWKYPKWQRVAAEVKRRCSDTCQGCGWQNPFPYPHSKNREMVLDHVVPLARGGTNDLENFQLLCGPCNGKKGARG